MVHPLPLFLTLLVSGAQGAPLNKRIAQTISAATTKWEQACIAAGGAQQCNPVSVAAFSTLLAAPGPCEQQNAADKMIDLAKTLNNDPQMISLAQIFRQQPRNTPTSQSVQYCQEAPKNPELNGLFQCQFAGANPNVFVGGIAVGQSGTIPFGLNAPLTPAGSCPANPNGPVPDGSQLVDITQNPGATGGKGEVDTPPPSAPPSQQPPAPTATANPVPSSDSPPMTTPTAGGGFKLQNGKDAQNLNAKFASLDENAPCQTGDEACIGTSFAQCVNGKFVTTSCAASLSCLALPLVNAPGTSITCTTEADAAARIAATGATGGITGSGNKADSPATTSKPATPVDNSAASSGPSPAEGDFKFQNAKDAQALNAKFAALDANSTCTSGDEACIGAGFAQCVDGKFVVTSCGANLICAALPLVNKPGTTITCTTASDAAARIQAAGATGSITGA